MLKSLLQWNTNLLCLILLGTILHRSPIMHTPIMGTQINQNFQNYVVKHSQIDALIILVQYSQESQEKLKTQILHLQLILIRVRTDWSVLLQGREPQQRQVITCITGSQIAKMLVSKQKIKNGHTSLLLLSNQKEWMLICMFQQLMEDSLENWILTGVQPMWVQMIFIQQATILSLN